MNLAIVDGPHCTSKWRIAAEILDSRRRKRETFACVHNVDWLRRLAAWSDTLAASASSAKASD
jgi:hypothetical protein